MELGTKPIKLAPGGAEVDPATGRYTLPDGKRGRLTALERVTLLVLLAHRGAVVTREALFATAHAGMTADASGLRAVDQAVSRLRRRIFPNGGGGISAVRGRGYRLSAPDEEPPDDAAPKSEAPAAIGLVGRVTELALVESELAITRRPTRHVELVGAGGIGKSTLARTIVARALDRGEAATWVDVVAVSERGELVGRLCHALGITTAPESEAADLVRAIDQALAAEPRRLLVLDDVDEAGALLAELFVEMPALRATRVLLTARRSHAAAWSPERGPLVTIVVGPLAFDDALTLANVRALEGDARHPTEAELMALAELARRAGGWPLAIELAIARWRSAPEHARPALADALSPEAFDHERLAGVLAAMWDVLTPSERRVLRALALGRGLLSQRLLGDAAREVDPATAAALTAVQRGGWLGPRRVEGRLELHALVRDFVLTRVGPGDACEFVAHLARHAERLTRAPISMDTRVMGELAQVAPVLEIGLQLGADEARGDVEARGAMLLALGRHHHLQGPREQAIVVAERIRAHVERCGRELQRSLLGLRASILLGARIGDGGRADARAMLALSEGAAERVEALSLVARTHRERPEVSVPALREAITLADSPLERARAESVLAAVLAREERFDEACAPMMRAVDTFERLGVETRFAEENFLAFVLVECGMSAQAKRAWDAAEAAYTSFAKRPVRPGFIAVRSLVSLDQGDHARAVRELEQVVAQGGELGRPGLAAQACIWRVVCEILEGRIDEARRRAADPFAELDERRHGRAVDALEAADLALLHGLRALLAERPELVAPQLSLARAHLAERFPSTGWLIDVVAGTARSDVPPPTGLRARLAARLVERVRG